MKTVLFGVMLSAVIMFVGCSAAIKLADKIAPNQIDPVTNSEIVGTHTPTPITEGTAGVIPYGTIVLSAFLLAVNFYQRFQANKVGKGLKATIQAIEQAGEEPATAAAIADLKIKLSQAHQIAGVQPLINSILAKI